MENNTMQNFGEMFPQNNPFENAQSFSWDGVQNNAGFTMPMSNVTTNLDLSELVYIKGYIAGRKNTLTKSFDQEKATAEYKKAFEEKAGTNKSITVNDVEIKSSFSQKNYKALLGEEEFKKLTDSGKFYKLNVKEGNPEYLVLESKIVEKSAEVPNINQSAIDATSASSADSTTIVVKPKALSDLLYNTAARGFVQIKDANGKELGIFSPQKMMNKIDEKTGKNKIALRYFPKNENGTYGKYVAQLGIIKGLTYAVNKSFEGETVKGKFELSNQKQISERYPELLSELGNIGLTLPREVTKGTDQTIPYEVYKEQYEAMGVTPNMLEKLRSAKSKDRDAEITVAEILAGFSGDIR